MKDLCFWECDLSLVVPTDDEVSHREREREREIWSAAFVSMTQTLKMWRLLQQISVVKSVFSSKLVDQMPTTMLADASLPICLKIGRLTLSARQKHTNLLSQFRFARKSNWSWIMFSGKKNVMCKEFYIFVLKLTGWWLVWMVGRVSCLSPA